MRKNVYLDYQASTPIDRGVFEAMVPYFGESFGNPHSSHHPYGWESAKAVEHSASQIALMVGADADEIIFTSGATEANNLAVLGLGKRASTDRRRILVSAIEHKCVSAACHGLAEQAGFTVEELPVDHLGFVDLDQLEAGLDDDVLLVSVMAVNNEIGTVQNIRCISELVRRYGAALHCDAAQAPIALDMRDFGALTDMLSLSGHKMYGPKGMGVLYAARHIQDQIEPMIYGGGQQSGLRSGTLPTPLCVGMGAAAELMSANGIKSRREGLAIRRDSFIEKLNALPYSTRVNGPKGADRHPGNANICFEGFGADEILGRIQMDVSASTGSACTSGQIESSHVLRAIGLSAADADASIRFSFGFETSDEDIAFAVDRIGCALSDLEDADLMQKA